MSTILVTGANRGIGKEVSLQLAALGHHVLLGSRNAGNAEEIKKEIEASGGQATVVELDVSSVDSIEDAVNQVQQLGGLDVLVNNAAINYDSSKKASNADIDEVKETLETNLFGAWRLTMSLLPLIKKSDNGIIVNVSSGAGALSGMGSGLPAYRVSKVSLNALTIMLAHENPDITINAVCPGWVATDMGGSGGRPVEDGAKGIVWAATLDKGGPTGGFFRDQQKIDW